MITKDFDYSMTNHIFEVINLGVVVVALIAAVLEEDEAVSCE